MKVTVGLCVTSSEKEVAVRLGGASPDKVGVTVGLCGASPDKMEVAVGLCGAHLTRWK